MKLDLTTFTKKVPYGQELVLDLHDVDPEKIHVKALKHFAAALCDEIGMKKGPQFEWGAEKQLGKFENPKYDGISVVQFLYESSIVIHCIDELGKVFINVFSCKEFSAEMAKSFSIEYWGGKVVSEHNIVRK